jgi:hypothetical protein
MNITRIVPLLNHSRISKPDPLPGDSLQEIVMESLPAQRTNSSNRSDVIFPTRCETAQFSLRFSR